MPFLDKNNGTQNQIPIVDITSLPVKMRNGLTEAVTFYNAVRGNIYGVLAGIVHGASTIFDYLTLYNIDLQVILIGRDALAFLANALGIDLFP